ncbi:MAG: branched-chain amino acid aminotransferase [Bacteroidetes bacterium]|nr:branched-chain amino acid aminotransferase [Bacteroidota bacterium]
MSLEITIKQIEHSRIFSFDSKNIIFGKVFTDHMFICDFQNGEWQNLRIEPFGKISLSPTLSALHYGQAIFEGMKAFKNEEGEVAFFRPLENHKRLNKTAERMCMPQLPEEIFMEGLQLLVDLDKDWIPSSAGSSLYIRPFMFATDDFLGVKQSETYSFMVYACPVNSYYSHNLKVRIEETYTRASKGGVGAAKCAGNYAAAMYPTMLAQQAGFDQVLWTDGETHSFIEETGTSNVFVITKDAVYTPELTDSLLAGITRKSILTLLEDMGKPIIQKHISITELIDWHTRGQLTEMFVSGTAAVITNIELFSYRGINYAVNASENLLSTELKNMFNDIKMLRIPDKNNWMTHLKTSQTVNS